MAFTHSKNTYVSLADNDISSFANSTTYNRSADSHDVTTYGNLAKRYHGGLLDGTVTIGGTYDDSATGPRAVIQPLLGTTVEFVFRPEGTGSGKPEDTVQVVVTAYNESSPVADMVQWTAELQMDGAPVSADQS
jgi:hypothetical protein